MRALLKHNWYPAPDLNRDAEAQDSESCVSAIPPAGQKLERVTGFEPVSLAWKAKAQPIYQTRRVLP